VGRGRIKEEASNVLSDIMSCQKMPRQRE
jgi:hypothetical protein